MRLELLAIAPDQITAGMWVDILQQAGIVAMIDPRDAISFLGVSGLPCRVLVPSGSMDEARALLPTDIANGWDS